MAGGIHDEYLAGRVTSLYGGHFARPEDRRRAVLQAVRPLAPAVATALEAQQARLPPSAERARSLAALRSGAAAAVTGQQVGLFLGPLYTLFKAAAAVRVAEALAAETGARVVPVFWLQTEDHDLVEIATTYAPGRHGVPLALEVPVAADNRVPVAHCRLPAEVDACLHELRGLLGHLPHAEEHLARLGRTYRSGAPWVAAFAGLLAELFAHTGLVLLDPRDPALAEVTAPLHRRALLEAGPLSRALLERVGVLEQGGFEVSIHVREDAPLSFFQPGSIDGARYRLEPVPGGFREVGGGPQVHSTDALLRALEQQPLRFSTSALLRPLLQDTLLPTAAYVGGPGEIAYFAQLAPLYAAFERPMPLVVPRARFRVVDAKAEELLARLGLAPEDATRDEAELLRRRANTDGPAASSPEAVEREALAGFEAALGSALAGAPLESPGFERAVGHARAKVRQAVARLRRKHEQALLHRDARLVEDVRRLKALLHPEGVPQERFYGLSAFAARSGERALVDAVLAAVSPFDPRLKDLRP